jgi:hypothetical protein
MTPTKQIERALTKAGWQIDGGFSAYLIVGHDGYDVSILAHNWVWDANKPVFELSGDGEDLTYWIDEIPTPKQGRRLLEENGGPSEEERGNTYKQGE